MRPFIAVATLLASLAGPATSNAQSYDPSASRAENQVNSLNRSMLQQERSRSMQQQNQFEANSLRNELSRPAPPPLVPNVGVAPLRR
jgi:hypothetical protein